MSSSKYLLLITFSLFLSGCFGVSPEWKEIGIEDREIEKEWIGSGVINPLDAKTYMQCAINVSELKDNNKITWKNFSTPQSACKWKQLAKKNKIYLDEQAIKILIDFEKINVDEKIFLEFFNLITEIENKRVHKYSPIFKDISDNRINVLNTILTSTLTIEEIRHFIHNYDDENLKNNVKSLEEWKKYNFSIIDEVLNSSNCSYKFSECYNNITPIKIYNLQKTYKFSFEEIVYYLENNLSIESVSIFKQQTKLSMSNIRDYLSIFSLEDALFIYKNSRIKTLSIVDLEKLKLKLEDVKEFSKKYEMKIEDILFSLDNNLKPNEVNELLIAKVPKELIIKYLKLFNSKNAKDIYILTNGTQDEQYLKRIFDALKDYNSAKKAIDYIKRIDENMKAITYRMNYDQKTCEPDTRNTKLEINVNNFKCRESVFNKGYDKCDIDLSYTIKSTCEKDFKAYLECDVEVGYKGYEIYHERSEYESNSENVYVRYGSHYGDMNFSVKVSQIMDVTVSARLKNAECKISRIYSY